MESEFSYSCKLRISLPREILEVILKSVKPEIGDIKERGEVRITSIDPLEFEIVSKDLTSLRAAINSLIKWIFLSISIYKFEDYGAS